MFALKKLIAPFLFPPGVFVLALVASGAYLYGSRRRKSGLAYIALGLVLWATCTAPVSNLLLGPLESQYPIPDKAAGDVIVLLGGGITDNVPDLSGSGVPKNEMLARLVAAVRLQRKLGVPIIVSGGRIDEDTTAEAIIVKRFLEDLGVEAGKIIVEDRSRDTYENAVYTRAICDRHAFRSPILMTSAYHMPRSVETFRRAGLEVVPYPTNFYVPRSGGYKLLSYLPTPESLSKSASAIHECLGLLYYRVAH